MLLWRGRRLIAAAASLGALLLYATTFLSAPRYSATVTLLPAAKVPEGGMLGQLAGLAEMQWLGPPSYEELYGEMLHSDRILDRIIEHEWHYRDTAPPVTLLQFLQIGPGVTEIEQSRARNRLKKELRSQIIGFSRDKATGVMQLTVTMPREASLAAAVANHLADELDMLNRTMHQNRAAERRLFTEERLEVVSTELRAAEENLTAFLRANRAYTQSPDLMEEYNSRLRDIQALQNIWLDLKRQVEVARIDENKNLPIIEVLDRAQAPIIRSRPRRTLNAMIGLCLGGLGAAAWILLRDQLALGNANASRQEA